MYKTSKHSQDKLVFFIIDSTENKKWSETGSKIFFTPHIPHFSTVIVCESSR
jgi:hypothetical protein